MNEPRTAFDAATAKKQALRDAEAAGQVADSMEVRLALMARVTSGEITLEAAQSELKRIKRGAKASGKVTRSQAYSRG
jgi:hypothetical protein